MNALFKPLSLLPLALLMASPAALAGRPLVTEDADVLEPRRCEWESFGGRTTTSGLPTSRVINTQLGCGVGLRTQVALGVARARIEDQTDHGIILGGKTQILPRSDAQPLGLTLAWGATWVRPSGGGTRHDATGLNLVATREWTPGLLTHANLGWTRSESDAQDTTTWNLAVEKSIGHGVDLMGEVFDDDRQRRPWLGSGIRWTLREDLSLNASYAVQSSTPRVKQMTLGFKWAF